MTIEIRDIDFTWDTNNDVLYWYRVECVCTRDRQCLDLSALSSEEADICQIPDPGGAKMMVMVAAYNLADLCTKLRSGSGTGFNNQGLCWPISSIHRYRRPVRTTDYVKVLGVPHTDPDAYEALTELDFRQVAECLELSLDKDATIEMGMTTSVEMIYLVNGSIEVTGSGDYSSFTAGSYPFVGSGILEASGAADTLCGSDAEVDMGIETTLSSFAVDLGDEEGEELTLTTDTVQNNCGCGDISSHMKLHTNFSISNKLDRFLSRNGLSMDDEIDMYYRQLSESWQGHFHFTGRGENASEDESWNLLFEWVCTNIVQGNEHSDYVWQLSIWARRVVGDQDKDSKMLMLFDQNSPCFSQDIRIQLVVNTQTRIVSTNENVEPILFYDDIGLFKSDSWKRSPSLYINLWEDRQNVSLPRYDIEPFV